MSGPLIAAVVWVLAATITALLPLRRQMVVGFALVLAAPAVIVWIGASHGWLWVLPALLAFLSMFRNPLLYFARRALGRPAPPPPPELAPKAAPGTGRKP